MRKLYLQHFFIKHFQELGAHKIFSRYYQTGLTIPLKNSIQIVAHEIWEILEVLFNPSFAAKQGCTTSTLDRILPLSLICVRRPRPKVTVISH